MCLFCKRSRQETCNKNQASFEFHSSKKTMNERRGNGEPMLNERRGNGEPMMNERRRNGASPSSVDGAIPVCGLSKGGKYGSTGTTPSAIFTQTATSHSNSHIASIIFFQFARDTIITAKHSHNKNWALRAI